MRWRRSSCRGSTGKPEGVQSASPGTGRTRAGTVKWWLHSSFLHPPDSQPGKELRFLRKHAEFSAAKFASFSGSLPLTFSGLRMGTQNPSAPPRTDGLAPSPWQR